MKVNEVLGEHVSDCTGETKILKIREAEKKFFLVARPLRGGGIKAMPLRKYNFFKLKKNYSEKQMCPLSSMGGRATIKRFFLRFP